MRVGIAHHLGWAVAVVAAADHRVIHRRRLELIEEGVPAAPVHHVGGPHALHGTGDRLDDVALAQLVAEVRASAAQMTAVALDQLVAEAGDDIESISLRAWAPDFPTDIAVLRRPPYESRADSVMYRQVLAEAAQKRGWDLRLYDSATVQDQATRLLGDRAHEVLHGPRRTLGPPWTKDHCVALAATVVASAGSGRERAPG